MIVVVGRPALREAEPAGPAGLACGIALAASAAGSSVELVGRVGDDAAGDTLLLGLTTAGVGHVAILRDPARPTPIVPETGDGRRGADDISWADPEPAGDDPRDAPQGPAPAIEPADVLLALEYLSDFAVLVVTHDVVESVLPVAVDGASYTGAHLVVLARDGAPPPGLPDDATVIAAPADDEAGAFARVVGTYAAGLDAGVDPATAFATATADGWEPPRP